MFKMVQNEEIEEVKEKNPGLQKSQQRLIPSAIFRGNKRIKNIYYFRTSFCQDSTKQYCFLMNSQSLEIPALQQDIAALPKLLKFKKFVIIGDIARMFYDIYLRQVLENYYQFLSNFQSNAEEP